MTSSGDASKQQQPEDLAGATIEPEDEEGLSTSEVTMHMLAFAIRTCCVHACCNANQCDVLQIFGSDLAVIMHGVTQ